MDRRPALSIHVSRGPATGRIVPPLSAKARGAALPKATAELPPSGHIGMVVARDAPKVVWGKLSECVRGR